VETPVAEHGEAARLRSELTRAQQELASQAEQIALFEASGPLKQENEELRARVRELEREATERPDATAFRESVERVRRTLQESLHSLQAREADVTRLKSRLEAAQASIGERDREIESRRKRLAAARETIAVRDDEIVMLRGSASRAQMTLAVREKDLAALNETLSAARQELVERDQQIVRLRDALAAAEKSRTQLERETEGLKFTIARREQEADRHGEAVGRSERALAASQQTLAARDDEIAALKQMNQIAEGRLAEQVKATEALRGQVDEGRKALAEQQTTQAELIDAMDALRRRIEERDREKDRLRESLASIRRVLGEPLPNTPEASLSAGEASACDDAMQAAPAAASKAENAREPSAVERAPELAEGGRRKLLGWMSLSGRKQESQAGWTRPDGSAQAAPDDARADADESEPGPESATEAAITAPENFEHTAITAPENFEPVAITTPENFEPVAITAPENFEPVAITASQNVHPAAIAAPQNVQPPAVRASENSAPAAIPAPVSRSTPAIAAYWERRHLADKLAPLGASDRLGFFALPLERVCREVPDRTIHALSLGGVASFEVALARALLDAGHKDFKIRLLSGDPESAAREAAAAEREGVAGNLEVRAEALGAQTPGRRAAPEPGFDVVLVPGDLALAADLGALLERAQAQLGTGGVLVVSSAIERPRSGASLAIAQRIFEGMPDRYKLDHRNGGLPADVDSVLGENGDDDRGRPDEVLPQLLRSKLHFESFVAFGGVGELFLGSRFGPNFDPQRTSDRRFVDQLVRLDDDKVDAGLLKPARMLAVLRADPVANPAISRGWTPAFCLEETASPSTARRRRDPASPSRAPSSSASSGS